MSHDSCNKTKYYLKHCTLLHFGLPCYRVYLQKLEHRKSATQMEKNAQFILKLDDLFDVANANALDLMAIEEDRAFLIAQRQKGRCLVLIEKLLRKKHHRGSETSNK